MLLALLDSEIDDTAWRSISTILESYLLRRAVCNLGTKNYNRIFLSLTRNLRKEGFGAAQLKDALLGQSGESGAWPDDAAFRESWLNKPLYGPLNSPKLVHLYGRLNQTFMSAKSESLAFAVQPTVEHIMPQGWIKNWSLEDGAKGLNLIELYNAAEDNHQAIATRKRDRVIQTIGNLTILSSGLNSAQSNYAWEQKRPELMKNSLLPLNQSLFELKSWNEAAIHNRAMHLFDRALAIWVR